jgi:PTS system nitrogen regulatory IIA component
MHVADLIKPENAHVDVAAPSKLKVLQILSDKASAAVGLPENSIFELLCAREKLGSTGIGGGIAIPHTRMPGLPRPFGLVARLKKAVDFDAVDEEAVDVVFLLLIPEHSSNDHLNALACVARRLRAPDVLQKMRTASDAAGFYLALTTEDEIEA